MTNSTTSHYRQVAAEGATYIGLLMVVLDSLAEDLRCAGAAVTAGDITGRCTASNHAFSLLGHLESWATSLDELPLRDSLLTFYAYVRSSIVSLQSGASEQPFYDLAMHVTQLRATWQQKETKLRLAHTATATIKNAPSTGLDHVSSRSSSWSA